MDALAEAFARTEFSARLPSFPTRAALERDRLGWRPYLHSIYGAQTLCFPLDLCAARSPRVC